MTLKQLAETLSRDLRRHWDPGRSTLANVQELALTQGVWATVVYRFGQWVYSDAPPALQPPAKVTYKLLAKAVEVVAGISVPASARIGAGFYIGHFGAIIVHPKTVMGENCSIGQGVTLGTRGQGDHGVPVLGDNVYVGAGAKVLGGVRLGNNVSVGANAVVVKDVPADSVALGVPAQARRRGARKGEAAGG